MLWFSLKGLADIILEKEWGGEGLGGRGGFSLPPTTAGSAEEVRSGSGSRLVQGLSEDSSREGSRLLAGRGRELV